MRSKEQPVNFDEILTEARLAQQQGNREIAILLYGRILASYPQYADALRQVGILYGESGEYAEATRYLERAVSQEPQNASALTALGGAYGGMGRFAEAREALDRALAIAPGMPVAHWNRAQARLSLGDYQGGWEDYEWGVPAGLRPVRTRSPVWDGGRDFGGTLFLWSEQGFGDTLQMVRFWQKAAEQMGAARVVIETFPELVQLFAAQAWEDVRICARPADFHLPYPFHQHASLMSLPHLLGARPDDLPSAPYLKAPEDLKAAWAERLQAISSPEGDFKVGLCRAGRPTHANDKHRSLPFDALLPLLSVEGATFYSLQTGDRAAEVEEPVIPLSEELTDFAVTAAVIANLDLVVTVDTAVAHLAGALGVPCWVLLSYVADWRWETARTTTPWYPSARLFRQATAGEWAPVIMEALKSLPCPL